MLEKKNKKKKLELRTTTPKLIYESNRSNPTYIFGITKISTPSHIPLINIVAVTTQPLYSITYQETQFNTLSSNYTDKTVKSTSFNVASPQ